MREAMLYERLEEGKIRCNLCHHHCIIAPSNRGVCGVRENREGTLYSLVYGKSVAAHVDPIEKKPLFHFYPGSSAFSVATVGCNFRCLHCQNADISQAPRELGEITGDNLSPEEIIAIAKRHNCRSISYTYTEPTVFFEYAYDTARLAHQEGIRNNFVTNGYMTEEALRTIQPYLDAANVDLKAFTEEHYRRVCGARLNPVLGTLRLMKKLGIWVEVTTLVIPTLNDSEQELHQIADFVLSLGADTPWHVTAFFPAYRMTDLPPTPASSLHKARRIGQQAGLRYVYSGNIPGDEGENTYCYNCGRLLIRRYGYRILENHIQDSKCAYCGASIDGVWT